MSDCYGRETTRKPRISSRLTGLMLSRNARAALSATLNQLPPRLTRLVPDAPPYKVHTVFYSKIFEPLKRLTQCSFILFSKIHCTTKHILPVRFHRFTTMDGGGSILAMFCREAKLETQNRTRMYILQPPRMAVVSNFQEF